MHSKPRRKVNTTIEDTEETGDKQDQLLLSAAICNGDDLGPFVRKAFASGKPESLIHSLRNFSRAKESEIEEICKLHYHEFISAVDDLRSLLSDVDSLKSSLSESNSKMQFVAGPLLASLDTYLDAQTVSQNVNVALGSVLYCIKLMETCSRANDHLRQRDFYMALRCVDTIEKEFVEQTQSKTIRRMLEKKIPEIRSYVKKQVRKEFADWLVDVRAVSRSLGQVAIGQASASRQREEDLRMKQREAEENGGKDYLYYLLMEDDEIHGATVEDRNNGLGDGRFEPLEFDLTPLYRALQIHQILGLDDGFKKYYFENRKLQLTSDFQVSSMSMFLESHQTFFAQIAGFFIVEDRVLRTAGGLISRMEVENLWEIAVSKMCSVLEDQFSRLETANHLLLIKDYVSLLCMTLQKHRFTVGPIFDVLGRHRGKYHELLLLDCKTKISEALIGDKLDQMLMKKDYEYSMNVLLFQLQTSDITPAFPYLAPFSSSVPECCRIVRSFIEDSVSYMAHCGQLDLFDIVKKYLDKLLNEVLDEALLKLMRNTIHGVSQAMQLSANMAVYERACGFFFRHAAQLSGISLRTAERNKGRFPLSNARDAAEEMLSRLLKQKIDSFLKLIENVNWMPEEPTSNGNEYVNEVLVYLETLVSTAQQTLPIRVLTRVLHDVLSHISEKIMEALLGDTVKRFNVNAIIGIDADVQLLESFAENQAALFPDGEATQLKPALVEARQLINLLLSNHPENFLNPVIRERSYNKLDHKKVVAISEKLKDPSDRLFGTFGSRASRQDPKKKSLDAMIKRLREA